MSRIPAFLMATLLLFSIMPVSLAQQNSMQAQAEADAHKDVNRDMKESLWFLSGLVSSSVCCAGGGVGFFVGGLILGDFDIFPGEGPAVGSCVIASGILCGVLTVPTAIFIYPHKPSPPLERLLGKSPEYIEVYLQAYRSKTISLRKRWVTAGSITANLGIGAMLLLNNIANR